MRKLIQGWVHRPGKHCASTVLSDLCHFYGLNLSEAFCLGLGAGLGFFYAESDALNPTRMIMTRSQSLEANFFRNLEMEFEWRTEPEPEQGWEKVKQCLDQNVPVLLRADIFHLDHYKSQTHFPLHIILIWGYDQEKNIAYIADTGWEGLIEIPLGSLSKARYSRIPFAANRGEYFPVVLPPKIEGLEQKARNAVKLQAAEMRDSGCHAAVRKAGESVGSWPQAKDAGWCFRWAYQIIERRGTGGGAFRKIYAQFLKEAGQISPEFAQFAPAGEMEIIGDKWTELSMLLKALSEAEPPKEPELNKARGLFLDLASREQSFFEQAEKKL